MGESEHFEKYVHCIAEIASFFPVKGYISLACFAGELIKSERRIYRNPGQQHITDKGNSHTGTGNVVCGHLLVHLKDDRGGKMVSGLQNASR